MRVLVTSAPAVGHLVPLLGLGGALRDAGHDVRVATHPDRHALITAAGLAAVAAGMSGSAMTQERIRRWPETTKQPGTAWALRMFTQILAPSTLSDLCELVDDWEPDLLVHEEGEYAGPVAAARADVPWVTHGWGSPLRPTEELEQLEEHAAGLWSTAGLAVPPWGGLYRHGLVNPCPRALQAAVPGAPTVWPVRPASLGPMPEPSAQPITADAYVGFGTVPIYADDVASLTAAVRGCTARGLRTVVTATADDIIETLAGLHRELVDARRFVSLGEVLSSCRVVVCHGGAGTVLAALEAGLPMVILCQGSPSQTRMAEACGRAGVAAISGTTTIETAIGRVLDDPGFQERSVAVREEICSMPASSDLVEPLRRIARSA